MTSCLSPSLARLESLPLWDGRKTYDIDVPRALLAAVGNPQDQLATIHVTGTNGKGSVSAMLAAILWASGKKVGQFASPHLTYFTERCLINGRPAELQFFEKAVSTVFAATDAKSLNPSFFEMVTVASFLEFVRERCEWAVVEVGLGGMRDATNTIAESEAAVVTGIDFDHMHILGDTLEAIARDKAGIFRRGKPVYVGKVNAEVEQVLRDEAESLDCKIEVAERDFSFDAASGLLRTSDGDLRLEPTRFALRGFYELENAVLAARIALGLGFSRESIQRGLEAVRWPGRCEVVSHGATNVLFDVAHNQGGMNALGRCLLDFQKGELPFEQLTFVISILERKEWAAMMGELKALTSRLAPLPVRAIFTTCPGHKTALPEELMAAYEGGEAIEDPRAALGAALSSASKDTLVVVTGSIFHVGSLRPEIVAEGFGSIAG